MQSHKTPYLEEAVSDLRAAVGGKMDLNRELDDEEIRDLITEEVFALSRRRHVDMEGRKRLADTVFNSMRGLDVLQPLMEDRSITEIMVNGPKDIFIEREGAVSRHPGSFENAERLEDVIQSVVSRTNRAVNEASPIVDARLEDGSRVNIVLKPAALNGPVMTIRKFPEKPMSMARLVEAESLSNEAAGLLESLVRAKYNIFISGGTGSGKTTFLNALSCFIPPDERIVTIEDSAELQLAGAQNIVRLETRNANIEGKGRIGMTELIRTSLRVRPDRIIVGEVRGEEALDMLQAMNTGHEGSLSTGHANTAADMLSRLETMVLGGASLPLDAIRKQIASAIDILVHLSRLRDKSRRVIEISEIDGCEGGEIRLNPLFCFQEEGETPEGKIKGSLKRTQNELKNTTKLRMAGLIHF